MKCHLETWSALAQIRTSFARFQIPSHEPRSKLVVSDTSVGIETTESVRDTVHRNNSKSVLIGGFATLSITRAELAERMVEDCLEARRGRDTWEPSLVFSSNGQGIALAGWNEAFADAMREATIIHADGMPVVLASKLSPVALPERIATTDFIHDAARSASEHGLRFYLLGATEDQNAIAAEALKRQYPDLKIVGRHHGYFEEDEDEAICDSIRRAQTDVLWVALGKPRQEMWCVRNQHRLRGVGWIKTCGGLYAFLSGAASRAPMWMQKSGLEWAHRLGTDPRRLGWRYLTSNPYALYRLLRHTERRSKGIRYGA